MSEQEKDIHEFGIRFRYNRNARILGRLGISLVTAAESRRQQEHVAELKKASLIDALTEAHNWNAFNQEFKRLHKRAEQDSRTDIGLMLLDVDGQKRVNDTLGHAEGDRLLRLTADSLREDVRPGDQIYRVGGDEFAVLLLNFNYDSGVEDHMARRVSDGIRLKAALAGIPQNLHVGATVALRGLLPNESRTDFYQRVDTELIGRKAAMRESLGEHLPADSRIIDLNQLDTGN
jgi:diguanylate cyclase (GGDEF)-like protein